MSYLELFNKRRLPVVLQTEASECGLACITMVSVFYGHDIDLNSMRARYPVSLKGILLDTLIDLAEKLDLGSRALKVDINRLEQVRLPAILHWDLNHYVVLKSIKGNSFVIHDPSRGVVKMDKSEFSDHFTGVALELLPTKSFKKQEERKKLSISSLWGRLIGIKRALTHTLILSIILQLSVLASPFYLQLVVDEAIVKYDLDFLFVVALGFGFIALISTATTMMRSWTILYYGNQTSFQLVANVFQHLIYLPVEYFEKRHVGDIMSRMGSTGPIQSALTQSVVATIIDGLMACITGVIIFVYSPLLGFIVLISLILLLISTLLYYPIMRRKQEEIIVREAKKESFVIESIRAMTTLKLFSAQSQRISKWRNLFVNSINANVDFSKNQIFMSAFHEAITALQAILVVYFAGKLIINSEVDFTVGMLFAFMAYRQHFTQSVTSLMEKVVEFRLLSLHLERISDISETKCEDKLYSLTNEGMNDEAAEIEFKDVYFRYSESDPWVLCGVSFKVNKGEFVSIIGGSGGGKTTLLKLLLGLYTPTEGEIFVDGVKLSESTRLGWRQKIGVVMQNDQLLTGTISDNISFFDNQMDMSKVHRVAKLAHIHDSIMAMPMKYLSFIGDMGSVLSAGQKQRVLLARALYRDSKTLILDEGTANIDEVTERQMVETIKSFDTTRVIVAHRPEFIAQSQRVLELTAGRIIERTQSH
jgi:ATP-binding cassette subfamily B protein RaxB